MARNKAIIRVTKKSYREQILKLASSRLDQMSKNLLIEIISNYLYKLKHPDNKHIPPMLPSGKSIKKLNETVGDLVLSCKKMKIVDAYQHVPGREVIRLTLAEAE